MFFYLLGYYGFSTICRISPIDTFNSLKYKELCLQKTIISRKFCIRTKIKCLTRKFQTFFPQVSTEFSTTFTLMKFFVQIERGLFLRLNKTFLQNLLEFGENKNTSTRASAHESLRANQFSRLLNNFFPKNRLTKKSLSCNI